MSPGTAARPQDCNGHAPGGPCPAGGYGHPDETWTERDHADQYIAHTLLPLLELADAFPKMIELVSEHLLARFGHAESEETRITDDDVICVWGNLASFAEGMQEMLAADRPEAVAGMRRLRREYAEGTWGWPS